MPALINFEFSNNNDRYLKSFMNGNSEGNNIPCNIHIADSNALQMVDVIQPTKIENLRTFRAADPRGCISTLVKQTMSDDSDVYFSIIE
jgi:hypothetical protein